MIDIIRITFYDVLTGCIIYCRVLVKCGLCYALLWSFFLLLRPGLNFKPEENLVKNIDIEFPRPPGIILQDHRYCTQLIPDDNY